jgi:hypothetical protein
VFEVFESQNIIESGEVDVKSQEQYNRVWTDLRLRIRFLEAKNDKSMMERKELALLELVRGMESRRGTSGTL